MIPSAVVILHKVAESTIKCSLALVFVATLSPAQAADYSLIPYAMIYIIMLTLVKMNISHI
jgi:hypothetical protein